MRIDARQIPLEGLTLIEEFSPKDLDLDTEITKFLSPIKVKANILKSYNAISVSLDIKALVNTVCSRCLKDLDLNFVREIKLNYAVDKLNPIIELDSDIREEIILDSPVKPLCKIDCKGLCLKCGKDLNQDVCSCK